MSVTALIAAYDADAGGLRALRTLAGATVIEHQLRRLAAAGVTRMILLLDEWPAALSQPLQRLRADGLTIDTVTKIADAADRLSGETRVLLLADGCLPERGLIERMLAAAPATLAVIPDRPGMAAYERIDADARWAGLAMLDGRALVDTATMVGDWDPVSTLLRRAVQRDAIRLDTAAAEPVMASEPDALAAAEARLVEQSRERPRGWAARHIESPIAELLLPHLFPRAIVPGWPAIAAGALALGGAFAALAERPLIGLILALPTGILMRIAARLALVQARPLRRERLLRRLRLTALGIGAFGIAAFLRDGDGQWGWLLLAGGLVAGLMALKSIRPVLATLGAGEDPVWLATVTAMPWTMLVPGLAGRWGAALAITAGYAIGSLGWQLWRAIQRSG